MNTDKDALIQQQKERVEFLEALLYQIVINAPKSDPKETECFNAAWGFWIAGGMCRSALKGTSYEDILEGVRPVS